MKKGVVHSSSEVLSKGASKAQRKAINAQLELERLDARERMEKLMVGDDEEDSVFATATKNAKNLERELGSKGGCRDAFGNTVASSNPSASKEAERLLARQRAEARARREAKFEAEAAAAAAAEGGSSSKKAAKKVLTAQEEIETVRAKLAANEPLSSKEKKLLKKHEESEAEENALMKEYESGLANYSLSIGGKGAMIDSDEEKDGDDDVNQQRRTVSACDVIVPSFTITAPHRVLFHDAMLKLVSGRRYGLIGPNGRGKTTLLKYIATRRMPVPDGVSVFMLDQEVPASRDPVVDQVLAADDRRTKLLAEESSLLSQLDASMGEGVDEEGEEGEMGGGGGGGGGFNLSRTVQRLQELGAELDAMGAYGSEAKVRKILTGLGFSEAMQDDGSMTLSGGWRVRVSLARALFIEPSLLCLDEPTNHLDIDAVLFLDDHLSTKWKGTVLTVSHDCDFLDNIVTDIIHVDEQKLNYYSGNVTQFEKMKNQILAKKLKNWKLQQKTLKEFTSQGLTVEKASKRTMEKLAIAELMDGEPREYRVNFNFKFAEDDAPTISVLDAGFYYPAEGTKAKKTLFSGLRFSIGTKSRVCLVGANGSGKTTLLKLLTGRLEPTEGVVSFHRLLRLGIYDQHFDEILPYNLSPIVYLTTQFDSVTELEARKYLGMFGLDGARHLIKIGELSGGQKARVVFAALALKRPHILVLDECTNHLDLESVDALVRALQVFPGGVVLVSHDARLISSLDCEIWVCEGGLVGGDGMEGNGIRVEKRGFDFYRLDLLRQIAKRQAAAGRLAEQKALRRRQEREQTLQRAQEKSQKGKKLPV